MLIVYAVPPSLYCAKLRILLRHKGLAWDEKPPPGGYGSDRYKEIVPSGNLPALVDGDLTLGDSEVIAEYLEQKRPTPSMLPSDPVARARVRELSRFHDTRLEPELRTLFGQIAPTGRDRALMERQAQAISPRLSQLGRLLGAEPRSPASTLQLGDCGYPITFAWLDALTPRLGLDVQWTPPVLGYRKWLRDQSAVAQELADYLPKLNAWIDSASQSG